MADVDRPSRPGRLPQHLGYDAAGNARRGPRTERGRSCLSPSRRSVEQLLSWRRNWEFRFSIVKGALLCYRLTVACFWNMSSGLSMSLKAAGGYLEPVTKLPCSEVAAPTVLLFMRDLHMAGALVPDVLWNLIEPLLPVPSPKPRGGRPRLKDRECLAGIIFVLRSGVPCACCRKNWVAAPV